MLKRFFKRTHASQKGITGLETAIILIAFVVVAAVFAYTVLSAGLFGSQESSEAIYSGLQETQSTLEIKGSVIGFESDAAGTLGHVKFTLANAIGGEAINFTQPTDADNDGMADTHNEISPESWVIDLLHRSVSAGLPIVIESRFKDVSSLRQHVNWLTGELM